MTSELLAPDELPDLLETEDYKALPFDQRQKVLTGALGEAHQWQAQNGGWDADSWKQFGELANVARERVTNSETLGEKAKYVAGTIGGVVKDSAVSMAVGSAGMISPVMGEVFPVSRNLGANLKRAGQAGLEKIRQATGPETNLLESGLKTLQKDIDEGNIPFGDAPKMDEWLKGHDETLTKTAAAYQEKVGGQTPEAAAQWSRDNGLLGNPQNAGLLANYMQTRDPSALDALRANLLTTKGRAETTAAQTAMNKASLGGRALDAVGLGSQTLAEAGDPLEIAGNVLPVIKGAKLVQKGVSVGQKLGTAAVATAGEVASELGSQFIDNPNATWEQRAQVAKETLYATLGLAGIGAAAGRMTQAPDAQTQPQQTPAAVMQQSVAQPQQQAAARTHVPAFADPNELAPVPVGAGNVFIDMPKTPAALEAQRQDELKLARIKSAAAATKPSQPVIPDAPYGGRDVLDFVNENVINVPAKGQRTGGEYDWQETADIPKYYKQFLFHGERGSSIDKVAQRAFDENLIPDPTPDALIEAIQGTIGARKTYKMEMRQQEAGLQDQELRTTQFDKAQEASIADGGNHVPFDQMFPGDELTIDGERVEVQNVETDEDGYPQTVTLKDGKRFGVLTFDANTRGGVIADEWKPKNSASVTDTSAQPGTVPVSAVSNGPESAPRDKTATDAIGAGSNPATGTTQPVPGSQFPVPSSEQPGTGNQEPGTQPNAQQSPTASAPAGTPDGRAAVPVAEDSAPNQGGPGAASAREYKETTTLKDSVERFRAIGADDPFLYRASPEKELDDLARTVIDEDARGLEAVTNDLLTIESNDLGLTDREHAAMLGHAMWKWATLPASEAQTANIKAIREVLKPVGSRGGQLLQVFDYIKRLDPEFKLDETLDKAETQRGEAIQTATGMTEAEIEAEIARRVQEELDKLQPQMAKARTPGQQNAVKQTAQEKAAKAVMDKLKPRAPRLKGSDVNRMVKSWMDATEAGIVDKTEFRAAFEQAFKIPKAIPAGLAADLRAKAVKARGLPQGSSERLALEKDIEDDLAIHSGVSTWELFKAGWYQNILSGAGFQVVNAVGSIQNMVTPIFQSIGDAAAGNPASFIAMLKGAKRGLQPAAAGLTNTVKTGRAYKGGEKYGDVSASELTARGWASATPAQKAIYTGMAQGLTRRISRIGAGVDVFFNSLAREMGAQTAAARKLSAKGLRYGTPEYKAAYAKELGFDGTKWADAMAKAAAELKADGKPVTHREIKRRALETASRDRALDITEASSRMADRMTYQQDPEGSGKIISKIIEGFQGIPVAGRLLLPFNKIVSNFFAENLDYGGVGMLRAALGEPVTQRITRAQGREVSQPVKYETQERRERAIKAVVGMSAGLAAVAAAMANRDEPDDDDNAFMIYGAGPKSKTERDAWTEAGNKPFSVRLKGRVIPFTETVLAVPLAVAGTYMDAQRYGTLKDHPTAAARLMFGSLKSMEAVANFGPLASVRKGMDMMQGRTSSTNSMVSMSGVKGVVPAAALLRDIEQLMDPQRVDDSTLAGAILGDIPGLSAYQDLKLNRFGEAADDVGLPGIRRIIGTTKKPEAVIKFMLEHDLTMPGAADVTRVAQDMTFPEDPAMDMDRINKLHLTRAEDRAFKQESGRLLKDGILRTMKEIENGEAAGRTYLSDALQNRIQAIDRAAEIIAKRKLMGR